MSRFSRNLWWVLMLVLGLPVAVLMAWSYSRISLDRNILVDSPCAPPCWHGITPGMPASVEEVIGLLKRVRGVNDIEVQERLGGSEVVWCWGLWPWHSCYNGVEIKRTVDHVHISIEFELTVQDILEEYGNPEVTTTGPALLPEESYAEMNLIYPSKGLWFRAMLLSADHPAVEPTTEIYEVLYIVPVESLDAWIAANPAMKWQPWPGYGAVRFTYP